jgi:uncharacterized glyoxalase superfamily protein PhnB
MGVHGRFIGETDRVCPAERRAAAGLHKTIPAMPVRDVPAAAAHYREHFGFETRHEAADFAVLTRDDAVLHLWGATDVEWRSRDDLTKQPICSGAESFLAGTASCRIEVADIDALFDELERAGVLHEVSRGGVDHTDFGTREFATVDLDGNLLTFFRWEID